MLNICNRIAAPSDPPPRPMNVVLFCCCWASSDLWDRLLGNTRGFGLRTAEENGRPQQEMGHHLLRTHVRGGREQSNNLPLLYSCRENKARQLSLASGYYNGIDFVFLSATAWAPKSHGGMICIIAFYGRRDVHTPLRYRARTGDHANVTDRLLFGSQQCRC